MKILYAEDEPALSRAVAEILKMEGYDVDCVYDGAEALEHLKHDYYDGAVLDIMMPKMNGIEVLKTMRENRDYTPVLMLTAKSTTDDLVEGLNIGADDYLGKPFVAKELLAHLRSLLRRNSDYRDKVISFNNVSLDCETGELKTDKGSLRLSGKETALLSALLKHPGSEITLNRVNEIIGAESSDRSGAVLYLSYLKNKLKQIYAGAGIVQTQDGCRLEEC